MKEIMRKIDFPKEAVSYFSNLNSTLRAEDRSLLNELQKQYMDASVSDEEADAINAATDAALEKWAAEKSISPFTAKLFFLLYCLPQLHNQYQEAGLSDEMFYGIAHDLTNKLKECMTCHGVFGTFVFSWFHRHFLMKLFALGRFQYEVRTFTMDDVEVDGTTIHQGDTVYNFHIPSSGPLTREARQDSYRRAFEFFPKREDGTVILSCGSWLLYPENYEIYPENSNLRGFFDDFHILKVHDYDKLFPDAWRVFGLPFTGDTSVLPADTTLQRNFIKQLEKGNIAGDGFGVIVLR